jgi:hypothetical protein
MSKKNLVNSVSLVVLIFEETLVGHDQVKDKEYSMCEPEP